MGETSEQIAHRVVHDIIARLNNALDFPEAAPARDYVQAGLRVVIKHNYAAYFSVSQTELIVLRVIHTARDIDAVLTQGGFDPVP